MRALIGFALASCLASCVTYPQCERPEEIAAGLSVDACIANEEDLLTRGCSSWKADGEHESYADCLEERRGPNWSEHRRRAQENRRREEAEDRADREERARRGEAIGEAFRGYGDNLQKARQPKKKTNCTTRRGFNGTLETECEESH
jgi:hypothetical protein